MINLLSKPTRYLDLELDPIGYPAPVKLLLRPEFMAMALCATALGLKDDKTISNSLAGAAVGMVVTSITRKTGRIRNKSIFGDKAIDKTPSEEQVDDSFKYRWNARHLASSSLNYAAYYSALLAGSLHFNANFTICLGAGLAADKLGAYYTFRKLAKGNYALVDNPLDGRALPAPRAA